MLKILNNIYQVNFSNSKFYEVEKFLNYLMQNFLILFDHDFIISVNMIL